MNPSYKSAFCFEKGILYRLRYGLKDSQYPRNHFIILLQKDGANEAGDRALLGEFSDLPFSRSRRDFIRNSGYAAAANQLHIFCRQSASQVN
jgi:hypothetical protein